MRITEFATNLFSKFAPISTEAGATLTIELTNKYKELLSNMESKEKTNNELTAKAEEIKNEIGKHPFGSPEHEKAVFQFTELQDQFEKPTILERAVTFLEKPLVRVLLLISFAFIARWLTVKLTSTPTPKDEEPEEVEVPQNNYRQQPNYGFNPNYPPMPYYYPPQQQQHYAQGKH